MVDWVTISSLATAGGTLVLAIATFSSVRSSNRTARSAEQSIQIGTRPVLFASHPQDLAQIIAWGDRHRATLLGGGAVVEYSGGVLYLAMSLRNVANGIAVLHGWYAAPAPRPLSPNDSTDRWREELKNPPAPEQFRPQGRDLYVPAGDVSFWQAAMRDPNDPDLPALLKALDSRESLLVHLLYGDHEGGQRTISLFNVTWDGEQGPGWSCSVARHWNLDRPNPR